MKTAKKTLAIIIILLLIILSDDCSSTLYHDKQNPCTKGEYGNAADCNEWKKNFPREYQHYINRLNKRPKSN